MNFKHGAKNVRATVRDQVGIIVKEKKKIIELTYHLLYLCKIKN